MYGAEGGEVKVTILSGNSNVGSEITLRGAEAIIGRAPDCEVVLDHPTVSARHARIFLRDGQYFVEDTQSTNGTAVNGLAISGPVGLKSGDLVQVGEVHVLFQHDAAVSDGATMVYGAPDEGQGAPVGLEGPTIVEGGSEGATMVADPASMSGQTSVMPAEGSDYSSGGETMVSPSQDYSEPPTAAAEPSAEYGGYGGLDLSKPSSDYQEQQSGYQEQPLQEQEQSSSSAPSEPAAVAASGGAIDQTHDLLSNLSNRATDLQNDIQAVTESLGRLEGLLAEAEQERDAARGQLQSLSASIDEIIQSTGDRKAALGASDVLSNLDGLVAQPNDLALLVNVSRDAGRYANLIRLNDEVLEKLRALAGNA